MPFNNHAVRAYAIQLPLHSNAIQVHAVQSIFSKMPFGSVPFNVYVVGAHAFEEMP